MRNHIVPLLLALAASACKPGDILDVPPPTDVLGTGALQNKNGAELLFNGGQTQFFQALQGGPQPLILNIGWFTDELQYRGSPATGDIQSGTDARVTAPTFGHYVEMQDNPWRLLLQARSSLIAARGVLKTYESGDGLSKIGEVDALAGFTELFIAETFCAGTPLSEVLPGGVVQYGTPLSTDSIQTVALAHFAAAATETNGDPTVTSLAAMGRARLLLDRNQVSEARAAVANVPTSFEYDGQGPVTVAAGEIEDPNMWTYGSLGDGFFTASDTEGRNGLNFVSAHDPRLVFDTAFPPLAGEPPLRIPTKFEVNPSLLPIVTGIEARLIEAEAALVAGNTGLWLADLNTLRATARVPGQTGTLAPLVDPGSDSARVSLLFRERAFWLFGTGTRLDDMRRLVRQYGRPAERVYPTGPYAVNHPVTQAADPFVNYGTDVVFSLPTLHGLQSLQPPISESNPHYRGCIEPTTVP